MAQQRNPLWLKNKKKTHYSWAKLAYAGQICQSTEERKDKSNYEQCWR